MTHGCALDKKTNSGKITIERLSFLRIRSVGALPRERANLLRGAKGQIQPYEALYLGTLAGIGESYTLVSDPYFVPAEFFGPELSDYPTVDGSASERLLTITKNDSRTLRLSEDSIDLLHAKWIAFWTRRQQE